MEEKKRFRKKYFVEMGNITLCADKCRKILKITHNLKFNPAPRFKQQK